MRWRLGATAVMLALASAVGWLFYVRAQPVGAPPPEPERAGHGAMTRQLSTEDRVDAIARAQVWHEPRTEISNAFLEPDPIIDVLSCRFRLTHLGGTTPKFDCALDDGELVRVKYGNGPEIPGEAAATRLLRALGFGSDQITLVERLRCYGCPVEPFTIVKAVQLASAQSLYASAVNYNDHRDFEWVAIERKFDAWPIETATQEGWAMPELDRIDARRGGAPRAHVDALRLLAVFLAHWDNKADNQRLVCETPGWREGTPCPAPLMLLQDVGATFGPRKVNLRGWRNSRIWADRSTCLVTMRHMPYSGATFQDVRIGEEGRRFLVERLAQLSDDQIARLFEGARFDRKRGLFSDVRPIDAWVEAFRIRRAMISEGPPCPPL